jgi:hypothetical protein
LTKVNLYSYTRANPSRCFPPHTHTHTRSFLYIGSTRRYQFNQYLSPSPSRFYLYNTPGQEAAAASAGAGGARQRKESHSAPGSGGKPSLKDIKKETEDSKDQGVKPTMETQGKKKR